MLNTKTTQNSILKGISRLIPGIRMDPSVRDMLCCLPVSHAPGREKQKFSEGKSLPHCEGSQAGSTALDLGSSLAGVQGFESLPSHNESISLPCRTAQLHVREINCQLPFLNGERSRFSTIPRCDTYYTRTSFYIAQFSQTV